MGGAAADGLTDFAAAYAKLSSVPAIALWLFDATGVTVLEAFAAATTGAMADDMRVHLGSILANCTQMASATACLKLSTFPAPLYL